MRTIALMLVVVAGTAWPGLALGAEPTSAGVSPELARQFESRIRPILVEHCHECHGPTKQMAGLRLDSREAVLRGSDAGPVVKLGRPEASLLVEAIRQDDLLKMPPPPKERLSDDAVAALSEWIRVGLPWPEEPLSAAASPAESGREHWAFQPIRRPAIPEVKDDKWSQSPIDRFILRKLEEGGLRPSRPADRRTLIRRATFDLWGLPPTPEEVAAFESDRSAQAFEKLIDRLLASPHYGERWGRHWLDVARYADNKGYVFFEDKNYPWAWTYRDYVIRAFNDDLPYDRFLLEQLAADQLVDDRSPAAPAAMGFLTLGARFMNNLHDVIDDRIDVTTRGLMGLTVTCARCHDHKFDPISQADYYSLYGIFRSSTEPMVPPLFAPPPADEAYEYFAQELEQRQEALEQFVTSKHNELVTTARRRARDYLLAAYATRDQPPTDDFMLLVMEGELNPTMLLRWKIYLDRAAGDNDPIWAPWHAFSDLPADEFAARAADVARRFAGADSGPEAINPTVRAALFEDLPASMEDVAQRYGTLLTEADARWQRFVSEASAGGRPMPERLEDPAWEQLRQVLYGPGAPPNVPLDLGQGFLTLLPDRPSQEKLKTLLKDVETWLTNGPAAPPRAMVLVDSEVPYEPRIFLRGNPHRLGKPVPRRFLSLLSKSAAAFEYGSGRLELARAIVDPENPLTARVLVNRVWMHHFGEGLVRTPSDFGLRSAPPSHPELLDYLAASFIDNGWSIKDLHRRIMTSAVYQQESQRRLKPATLDPENRLLWRMNRRRLDFEGLRDALLFVSGSLDTTVGGPPVDLLSGRFVTRRTVYGFVDRMNLPGLFRVFDFPNPLASSPQRDATTVPPQALFWMNDDFVAEAAQRLASRADCMGAGDVEGITDRLYRVCFGRAPTSRERAVAHAFLGPQPAKEAWSQYAQGLLMTNEFVFID